jgi:hypothetical protein
METAYADPANVSNPTQQQSKNRDEPVLSSEYQKFLLSILETLGQSLLLRGVYAVFTGQAALQSLPSSKVWPKFQWAKMAIAFLVALKLCIDQSTRWNLGLCLKIVAAMVLIYYTISDSEWLNVVLQLIVYILKRNLS